MSLKRRITSLLCYVSGASLLMYAFALTQHTLEIHFTWIRTVGVVVAIPVTMAELLGTMNAPPESNWDVAGIESSRPTTFDGFERPIIEFTDAAGVVRRTVSVAGTELPSLHSVGDLVPLAYSPADPYESCVSSTADEWMTPVVLFGAGMLLMWVPRLVANRLRLSARLGHDLPSSPGLQWLAFALASFGPPIAGISPGRVTAFQSVFVAAVSASGVVVLLVLQVGRARRSPLVDALPVTLAAVSLDLAALERIVVAESRAGLACAAFVFLIGIWPALRAPARSWRKAAGVIVVALSVVGLAAATIEALHTPGDVPPVMVMTSVIGLGAGNFLCGSQPVPSPSWLWRLLRARWPRDRNRRGGGCTPPSPASAGMES